jgi:hypothetical protein
MNASEKQKLKSTLPLGWVALLQDETGYSKSYISQVLRGKKASFIIERAAVRLARKHKADISMVEKLKNEIL